MQEFREMALIDTFSLDEFIESTENKNEHLYPAAQSAR
jgi:hypothetical protein